MGTPTTTRACSPTGLLALPFALDVRAEAARWSGRLGAASAVAALALYDVLQAVDGVALKQAVDAWVNASEAEKTARFASAEAIRWLEWGVRSYQDLALGLALLLIAAALLRAASIPRPVPYLVAISGLTHLVQGWVVGSEGFSATESTAIVVALRRGRAVDDLAGRRGRADARYDACCSRRRRGPGGRHLGPARR